ncbi:UNVERIFIED_CONTAM: hypothetical protein K2H54_070134, partial [Gekko kuhli]
RRGDTHSSRTTKMASAPDHLEDDFPTDTLTISRQELVEIHKDLHRSLRETVEELIQPINTRLDDFISELKETTKKADANTATCVTLQEEVRHLQDTNIDLSTRLLAMENRWRQHNLKFRGFEEGVEENTELPVFLSNWLAHALQLEDGVAPAIAKAYRLDLWRERQKGAPEIF